MESINYRDIMKQWISKKLLTWPPESFETGEKAKDITGSGTFMAVMVHLTDPSVNVSPQNRQKKKNP